MEEYVFNYHMKVWYKFAGNLSQGRCKRMSSWWICQALLHSSFHWVILFFYRTNRRRPRRERASGNFSEMGGRGFALISQTSELLCLCFMPGTADDAHDHPLCALWWSVPRGCPPSVQPIWGCAECFSVRCWWYNSVRKNDLRKQHLPHIDSPCLYISNARLNPLTWRRQQ